MVLRIRLTKYLARVIFYSFYLVEIERVTWVEWGATSEGCGGTRLSMVCVSFGASMPRAANKMEAFISFESLGTYAPVLANLRLLKSMSCERVRCRRGIPEFSLSICADICSASWSRSSKLVDIFFLRSSYSIYNLSLSILGFRSWPYLLYKCFFLFVANVCWLYVCVYVYVWYCLEILQFSND